VIKESFVQVPGADDRIKPGDTVLLLVADEAVEDALKLFQRNSAAG
jgi:Trk K+ transport system NAD-binding subunit